ncbi:hypothetical protein PVA38_11240 [Streptococcus pneumoniae D39]|nr:hypothetical protein PVA38_11240 [Streptococcus pneumoniae D39]
MPVSYTHLRAHETVLDFVCRLLLEKKKYPKFVTAYDIFHFPYYTLPHPLHFSHFLLRLLFLRPRETNTVDVSSIVHL